MAILSPDVSERYPLYMHAYTRARTHCLSVHAYVYPWICIPCIRITDLTFIIHRAFYTDYRARLSIVRPRLAPLATPRSALAPYHPQDTPCPDSRTA